MVTEAGLCPGRGGLCCFPALPMLWGPSGGVPQGRGRLVHAASACSAQTHSLRCHMVPHVPGLRLSRWWPNSAMLTGTRAGQLGAASSAGHRTDLGTPRALVASSTCREDSPAGGQQLHGIAPCCGDGDHTWKSTCSPLPAPPRARLCQLLPGGTGLASLHFPLANKAPEGTCPGRGGARERAPVPHQHFALPWALRCLPPPDPRLRREQSLKPCCKRGLFGDGGDLGHSISARQCGALIRLRL